MLNFMFQLLLLSINGNIKFLENIMKDLKEQFLGINVDLKKQTKQKTII